MHQCQEIREEGKMQEKREKILELQRVIWASEALTGDEGRVGKKETGICPLTQLPWSIWRGPTSIYILISYVDMKLPYLTPLSILKHLTLTQASL